MKHCFKEHKFSPKNRTLVEACDQILSEYDVAVTLRHLFYRLVSAGLLINQPKSYKHLVAVMTPARMAGMIDMEAIVDLTRAPDEPLIYRNIVHLAKVAADSFALDWWQGQRPVH